MIRRKFRKQTQKTEQVISDVAGQSAGQQMPPTQELSPEERRRRRNKEEIKSFFFRLIILLLFLWLIFGVCFGVAPVRNGDMFPRISAGDLMLYYRLERDYNSQDVIVYEKDGQSRVGRVIAHGGDTVEITGEGEIKINGSIVMENNVFYDTYPMREKLSPIRSPSPKTKSSCWATIGREPKTADITGPSRPTRSKEK